MPRDTNLRPHINYRDTTERKQFVNKNIIGFFSIDTNQEYCPNASQLKYLRIPDQSVNPKFDLNIGYENVKRKKEIDHKLDRLLHYILDNLKKLKNIETSADAKESEESSQSFLNCDIVCFRGLLRLLMMSPYERRKDWAIACSKYKGTIYISALETHKAKLDREGMSNEHKKICSYGFKFEQYLSTDDPSKEPDPTQPVDECEEFGCILKSEFNGNCILYGAEMDGIEMDVKQDMSTVDLNTLPFVELKVLLKPVTNWQFENYIRFRLLNWWCQSYLVGTPKVLVGIRNPNGIVEELETIRVKDMPKMAKNNWCPEACWNFLKNLIELIQDKMQTINSPHTVYKFEYNPQQYDYVGLTILNGPNEYTFLHDWYIQKLK